MKYPEQESSTLELKREIPKNDQIIKSVIGFCNQNGGRLVIGVDNDGTIVGVPEDAMQRVLEYAGQFIHEMSYPPIIPRIYTQSIGEKTILIIEVSAGMNKPYYIKSEGPEKGVYIRLGRSTMRATPEIIDELRWQSRGLPYDEMPVYRARPDDLDTDLFKKFLMHKKVPAPENIDVDKALRAYTLIVDEQAQAYPTVAGILLFGKDPQHFLSESFIICSRFSGISGRETIATRDCMGPLFDLYANAYNFVVSHLDRSFTIKGPVREEKLEIPIEAIREVLINAVVHRNYHIASPTKIAIYDNRVEVFSPGSFPGPLNSQNLVMGFSYFRNTAIAKVFREMGYMEKMGTGFKILFESYAKEGLAKPEVIEGENYVKCILPRRTGQTRRKLSSALEERILNLFQSTIELSVGDIIKELHIPRATASRTLSDLVQKKALLKKGAGKGTRYMLRI